MVIKKLNSVFHKHSRLLFGIFALLIIVAFTPGIMDGCNQDPGKQTAGTVMDEKVTYSDLAQFMPKTQVALALLIDDSNRMPTDDEHRFMLSQLMGKKDARQLDYNELLYLYAMEKYAENIGISVSDKEIADMVKTRIEVFPDIKEHIDFFETLPEYDTAMYCHKKMKTNEETSLEVLKEMLPILEEQEDYSNDALYEMLMKYVADKGCKNGYALWPIRTAVSGKQMTPAGATEIMEIIGKEETIHRVKVGIELLSK